MGRRRAPEIQDGAQITGSTNIFDGFTDTHVVPKTMHEFTTIYETSKSPPITADATSYLLSKIQDGGQPAGIVISQKLRNVSSKFQRLPLCFRDQPFY